MRAQCIIGGFLLALPQASCITSKASEPVVPITCKSGGDCEAKWSRAVSWVTRNSSYKVQTQTDAMIQTMGPLRSDPSAAFTVTKVATGSTGSYEITFNGGCGNLFGCVPSVSESRAEFAAYVNGI